MDVNVFKPVLNQLIQYYYDDLGNSLGGNLHIMLSDGNLTDSDIWTCQENCSNKGDDIGYLIATILRGYSEDDREIMYRNRWGMADT